MWTLEAHPIYWSMSSNIINSRTKWKNPIRDTGKRTCIDQNIMNKSCCSCFFESLMFILSSLAEQERWDIIICTSCDRSLSPEIWKKHLKSTIPLFNMNKHSGLFFSETPDASMKARRKRLYAVLRGVLHGRRRVWWIGQEPLQWHWQKGSTCSHHLERRGVY